VRASATSTSTPAPRGRLHDTFVSWEHALTDALAERPGVDPVTAETLAVVGIGVFRTATARWLREPGASLAEMVGRGFNPWKCPG
jgi:hypothetical protein